MALIICPECNQEISSNADICIHCGFPIKTFLKDNNLDDFNHLKICPKCANTNSSRMPDILPVNLKCRHCGTQVVQTDIPLNGLNGKFKNEDEKEYMGAIANKYGGNQFSPEEYDKWVIEINKQISNPTPQSPNTPKCPTCGSTNIQKISATKKAAGAIGFGLFSKTAKSQFECKNCGYKW